MVAKRLVWCGLILVAGAALVWAAEPSGGDGRSGGSNRAARGALRDSDKLPWPEPKAAAVKELHDELLAELPRDQFHIVRIGPWLVATDMDKRNLQGFLDSTIKFYAARIQRQLFDKPLGEPVKVYLFKNRASYEKWTMKLFGEKPTTPYGWFSRRHRGMYMNIATGGGTLLHEMTHAMTEADWPGIPAWMNEGLGSLFEASSRTREGRVIGITNWRLAGLQKELKAGTAPKFSDLLKMDDNQFYGAASGDNYASARYLMQYLQSKGQLETFYKRVRDKKDKDAFASLRHVFGNKLTVDQIEKACYDWVKTLRQ